MKKLLKSIKDNNIVLELIQGELKVFAKGPVTDPDLISQIRKNKGELIRFLKENDQEKFKDSFRKNIPVAGLMQDYPLSSSQHRLWVLSQFEDANVGYNIPGVYVFEGVLIKEVLVMAFETLVNRHEILRTVFRRNDHGDIRQFILPAGEIGFKITGL